MLCFIDMSNIPLPPKFEGTLQGLKKYNMFPNFFSYFVPSNGGDVPYKKAYDFGYKTNLLLLNSGNYISLFLCMMVFFFIVFGLSKFTHIKPFSIPFIKKQIDNTLANYKYGAFIRFWITCYLEIFAAAIIAVLTTTNYTVELGINFTVAAILIVIFKQIAVVATPILFLYFFLKNKNKIADDSEEAKANWGTLFYEFNNDKGIGSSMFYFFFFARRIFYIVIQFFLQDYPIIQLTLNIVLSVAVIYIQNFAYLVIFRPFSEPILNLANPICECGIFMIFSLTAMSLMRISTSTYDELDNLLVVFVNFIMETQMASSLLVFAKTIIFIIRKKMQATIVPINNNIHKIMHKDAFTEDTYLEIAKKN